MNKRPSAENMRDAKPGPQAIAEAAPKKRAKAKAARPGEHNVSLRDLYNAHSGKVSDKWSTYLSTYDHIFSEYRNRPVRILEIGVQNGGSLEIWRRYFANAELVLGCDINMACGNLVFDDEKIAVVIGDANTDEVERNIVAMSEKFDIIIDDGSHLSSDIIRSFDRYFPHLSEGGMYIAEDLHCSYWQEFEGGLYDPLSSMSFFKRLLDVINHEHWGLDRRRIDALSTFAERHNIAFEETSLASVHSIEFLNSLCVVTKRPVEENVLGARSVQGLVALADGSVVPLDGTENKAADQTGSVWSLQSTTMEEEIGINRELIKRHEARMEALAHEYEARMKALSHKITAAREQIRGGEEEIAQKKAEAIAKVAEIQILRGELSFAHTVTNALEARLTEREFTIQEFKDSTSWRITGPLRTLSVNIRWMLRNVRPGRVLEWWLGSGK